MLIRHQCVIIANRTRTETHAENSGYEYSFANHEAGFDSYLTARVLVRLSANLKTADQHDQERISDNVTSSEDGGVPVNNTNTLQVSTIIGQTVPNGRQMLRKISDIITNANIFPRQTQSQKGKTTRQAPTKPHTLLPSQHVQRVSNRYTE